ncbi:MAG TPA: hypothetical protein VNM16_12325 [Bacillota bacterium]|nr:hypothetical protein [Bacillota bacterium]
MSDLMQALLSETQGWLVATVVAMLPLLWAMTMFMNVGRPYFIRQLQRCRVRFGADVWWLSSVLIRDAVMVITLAASFLVMMPHPAAIAEGNPLALPVFAPLATEFLFVALAIKLTRDCDDDPAAFRRMLTFLTTGAGLYFVSTVFGIEANSQAWMAPVQAFLTSRGNPGLFNVISTVSVAAFAVTGAYLFGYVLKGLTKPSVVKAPPAAATRVAGD